MSTREDLRRRPDIDESDLDDIIGIAAELQQQEHDARKDAMSADAVRGVAAELDIDPRYVDAAIAELRTRREHDRAQAEAAARSAAAASAARRRVLGLIAAGLLAVGAGGAVVGAGVAFAGAGAVADAAEDADAAATQLQGVLDRQASLAPQLVALGGGDPARLDALVREVHDAPTVAGRLDASERLAAELSRALAELPPAADAAAAQQRLNIQYELVGSQNRVSTERRRYEAARLAWEQAASRPTGRLAVSLGLAPDPWSSRQSSDK